MGWFSIVSAALSLAREIIKYMREQEKCKNKTAMRLQGVRHAIRVARETKDTKHLEDAFKFPTSDDS